MPTEKDNLPHNELAHNCWHVRSRTAVQQGNSIREEGLSFFVGSARMGHAEVCGKAAYTVA